MGSSKPKTVQTPYQQTNSYSWQTMPDTSDVSALRNMKFEVDPSVSAKYGQANKQLDEGFNNPLGAFTTPAVRDATARAGHMKLAQGEAQETREAGFQNQ